MDLTINGYLFDQLMGSINYASVIYKYTYMCIYILQATYKSLLLKLKRNTSHYATWVLKRLSWLLCLVHSDLWQQFHI